MTEFRFAMMVDTLAARHPQCSAIAAAGRHANGEQVFVMLPSMLHAPEQYGGFVINDALMLRAAEEVADPEGWLDHFVERVAVRSCVEAHKLLDKLTDGGGGDAP